MSHLRMIQRLQRFRNSHSVASVEALKMLLCLRHTKLYNINRRLNFGTCNQSFLEWMITYAVAPKKIEHEWFTWNFNLLLLFVIIDLIRSIVCVVFLLCAKSHWMHAAWLYWGNHERGIWELDKNPYWQHWMIEQGCCSLVGEKKCPLQDPTISMTKFVYSLIIGSRPFTFQGHWQVPQWPFWYIF